MFFYLEKRKETSATQLRGDAAVVPDQKKEILAHRDDLKSQAVGNQKGTPNSGQVHR